MDYVIAGFVVLAVIVAGSAFNLSAPDRLAKLRFGASVVIAGAILLAALMYFRTFREIAGYEPSWKIWLGGYEPISLDWIQDALPLAAIAAFLVAVFVAARRWKAGAAPARAGLALWLFSALAYVAAIVTVWTMIA